MGDIFTEKVDVDKNTKVNLHELGNFISQANQQEIQDFSDLLESPERQAELGRLLDRDIMDEFARIKNAVGTGTSLIELNEVEYVIFQIGLSVFWGDNVQKSLEEVQSEKTPFGLPKSFLGANNPLFIKIGDRNDEITKRFAYQYFNYKLNEYAEKTKHAPDNSVITSLLNSLSDGNLSGKKIREVQNNVERIQEQGLQYLSVEEYTAYMKGIEQAKQEQMNIMTETNAKKRALMAEMKDGKLNVGYFGYISKLQQEDQKGVSRIVELMQRLDDHYILYVLKSIEARKNYMMTKYLQTINQQRDAFILARHTTGTAESKLPYLQALAQEQGYDKLLTAKREELEKTKGNIFLGPYPSVTSSPFTGVECDFSRNEVSKIKRDTLGETFQSAWDSFKIDVRNNPEKARGDFLGMVGGSFAGGVVLVYSGNAILAGSAFTAGRRSVAGLARAGYELVVDGSSKTVGEAFGKGFGYLDESSGKIKNGVLMTTEFCGDIASGAIAFGIGKALHPALFDKIIAGTGSKVMKSAMSFSVEVFWEEMLIEGSLIDPTVNAVVTGVNTYAGVQDDPVIGRRKLGTAHVVENKKEGEMKTISGAIRAGMNSLQETFTQKNFAKSFVQTLVMCGAMKGVTGLGTSQVNKKPVYEKKIADLLGYMKQNNISVGQDPESGPIFIKTVGNDQFIVQPNDPDGKKIKETLGESIAELATVVDEVISVESEHSGDKKTINLHDTKKVSDLVLPHQASDASPIYYKKNQEGKTVPLTNEEAFKAYLAHDQSVYALFSALGSIDGMMLKTSFHLTDAQFLPADKDIAVSLSAGLKLCAFFGEAIDGKMIWQGNMYENIRYFDKTTKTYITDASQIEQRCREGMLIVKYDVTIDGVTLEHECFVETGTDPRDVFDESGAARQGVPVLVNGVPYMNEEQAIDYTISLVQIDLEGLLDHTDMKGKLAKRFTDLFKLLHVSNVEELIQLASNGADDFDASHAESRSDKAWKVLYMLIDYIKKAFDPASIKNRNAGLLSPHILNSLWINLGALPQEFNQLLGPILQDSQGILDTAGKKTIQEPNFSNTVRSLQLQIQNAKQTQASLGEYKKTVSKIMSTYDFNSDRGMGFWVQLTLLGHLCSVE